MLLNGRVTLSDEKMPEPVKVDFDPGAYTSRAASQAGEIIDQGYAGSDEEVADDVVPDKSPVFSVDVLRYEDAFWEDTLPEEVYHEGSLEEKARMRGPAMTPEGVVERLEDDHVYVTAVVHASEEIIGRGYTPDRGPRFRIAEIPVDAELVNRAENLAAMNAVHEVVTGLDHDFFYDHTLWVPGYDDPEAAMEEARNTEMKFAAAVRTPTPFHIDVGYLSAPEEEGSEFGIEVTNRASDAVTSDSVDELEPYVDEILQGLMEQGFWFEERELRMEI